MTPELRRELLADHARRRTGRREQPGAGEWQEASLTSPTCGDTLTVRIRSDRGRVAAVEWTGMGCEVSQASASILAELVPGTPVAELPALVARVDAVVHGAPDDAGDHLGDLDDLGDLAALAGVGRFPVRGRCATLAWRALLRAAA